MGCCVVVGGAVLYVTTRLGIGSMDFRGRGFEDLKSLGGGVGPPRPKTLEIFKFSSIRFASGFCGDFKA